MTEAQEPQEPSFWAKTWTSFKKTVSWIGPKVLGPLLVVVLVIVAIILVSMGFKELQIGGIIGKLLGKKNEGGVVEVANSIDSDRIGKDGKLIQPGTPDSTGQTQAVVVPIESPGLFSDPGKVVFTHPGADKPTEIVLPDGVKNSDVAQVVVVSPTVVVVTVKDDSGVPAKTVEELLKKYGNQS